MRFHRGFQPQFLAVEEDETVAERVETPAAAPAPAVDANDMVGGTMGSATTAWWKVLEPDGGSTGADSWTAEDGGGTAATPDVKLRDDPSCVDTAVGADAGAGGGTSSFESSAGTGGGGSVVGAGTSSSDSSAGIGGGGSEVTPPRLRLDDCVDTASAGADDPTKLRELIAVVRLDRGSNRV